MDEMLKMVRKPSLSPSTKQSSRPSQFWSIPSPVSSSAPGFTPGSESAQSRSFSTNPSSTAQLLVGLLPVAPYPSPSRSRK